MDNYYEKFKPSFATSRFIDLKLAEHPHDLFPHEGIYIGELKSYLGETAPALVSLEKPAGLCFLSHSGNHDLINNVIQSIVLRLLASLPSGMCNVTLYDGAGLGANLISLSKLDINIIGQKIMSSPDELMDHLRSLEGHIPYVIQKVLTDRFANDNLIAYNESDEGQKEPYRLLVIADFPRTLSMNHYEKLKSIIRNSHKGGVFVILSVDTSSDELVDRNGVVQYLDFLDNFQVIFENDGKYYFKNSGYDKLLNSFDLTLQPLLSEQKVALRDYVNEHKTEAQKREVELLLDNLTGKEKWWTQSCSKELNLPFGRGLNSELVSLSITQVNAQNSAVVVGTPGSGKSNFLHTIVWSTLVNYSPDEVDLYLIDFSGVEFNQFAELNAPHIRVVAPEVELEYGLSVLEKIRREAMRREELYREAGVNSFEDYRKARPDERMPRILILVDEFQKFFEDKFSEAAQRSTKLIIGIIKEYRKFGINIILATQQIYEYRNSIELGLIANRVVFAWDDNDTPILFKNGRPMINLQAGECIYNDRAGDSSHNIHTMTFYSKSCKEELASMLKDFIENQKLDNYESIVFRRNAEVAFEDNMRLSDITKETIPDKVKIFLGEPIEISETHTYFELSEDSGANLLVIGGQNSDAAERIAINVGRSVVLAHEQNKSFMYYFNLINKKDLVDKPQEMFADKPINSVFVDVDDYMPTLESIKSEIERRREDKLVKRYHIYLNIFGFQNAYMFKKSGYTASKYSEVLQFILDNGPMVGVFTILQVDGCNSLKQTGVSLSSFNHRVLLQMSESDSRDVAENAHLASGIYEESRPSSKNRAYYYNKNNTFTKKFKPYSI